MKRVDFIELLLKASSGEGSRGGKIIGHTATGKPIYDKEGHAEAQRKPYPGEEQHSVNIPESQKKKTFMPQDGTTPHYSDPPGLKAYKVLMREFKKRGADFQGHITYDPKTEGVQTLSPQGAKITQEIVQEMKSKATPAPSQTPAPKG